MSPEQQPDESASTQNPLLFPFVEETGAEGGKRYGIRAFSTTDTGGILQGEYPCREKAEKHLAEFAVPLPGDAVRLTGSYIGCKAGAIAMINGMVGKVEPEYQITFHANAF